MRGHWFVVFAAGCGFEVSSQGSSIDAPTDGVRAVDAAGTTTCPWPYAPTGFDPCTGVPDMLSGLDLGATGVYTYDTDDGVLAPPTGGKSMPPSTIVGGARVLWTRDLRIGAGATLRAKGALPLVLVSQSRVTVEGTLDVGSYLGIAVGAGSDPPACASTVAGDGLACSHGGSGGGGGGFGTAGMAGGAGGLTRDCGSGPNTGITGGAGGLATADPMFRGGCDGGTGAEGDSSTAGDNGDGGGAIHVIARDTLHIGATGKVLAGGGGGAGGNNGRSGGGGGGSGGMILLSGTSIRIDAGGVIAANGGAGGGGADGGQAGSGGDGQPLLVAATGGTAQGTGGTGGNGAFGTTAPTVGTAVQRGGGGGGGGVGKIRLTTKTGNALVTTGAVITPPAP